MPRDSNEKTALPVRNVIDQWELQMPVDFFAGVELEDPQGLDKKLASFESFKECVDLAASGSNKN